MDALSYRSINQHGEFVSYGSGRRWLRFELVIMGSLKLRKGSPYSFTVLRLELIEVQHEEQDEGSRVVMLSALFVFAHTTLLFWSVGAVPGLLYEELTL